VKFVITGANGFIGGALRKRLEDMGQTVISVDKSFSVNAPLQFEVDISSNDINSLLTPDSILIHLAAVSNNNDFDLSPSLALNTNIVGTQNLSEISASKKIRHLIFASSEWIYPEMAEPVPLEETNILDLHSIKSKYGLSKLFSEIMLRQTSLVPTTILRFGIVYGPRPKPASAIEKLTWDAYAGKHIEVKSPESSRCFIHINDLVEGIVKTAMGAQINQNETFNLCGDKLISMRQVIETLQQILNDQLDVSYGVDMPSQRFPINDKFKKQFDWSPQIDLTSGISQLLSYYKKLRN
jgi:UDP-glucose 4-epimerase